MPALRPPHFDNIPIYHDGVGFGWVGYGMYFEYPSACFQIWVFKEPETPLPPKPSGGHGKEGILRSNL